MTVEQTIQLSKGLSGFITTKKVTNWHICFELQCSTEKLCHLCFPIFVSLSVLFYSGSNGMDEGDIDNVKQLLSKSDGNIIFTTSSFNTSALTFIATIKRQHSLFCIENSHLICNKIPQIQINYHYFQRETKLFEPRSMAQ